MMHTHEHAPGAHGHGEPRRLLWTLGLTLSFALIEAVAGWWSGSLALLGDAAHMLTDSLALGLAAAAAVLSRRGPSARHSFGLGRAEIMAAAINALAMVALTVVIVVEALARLRHPPEVQGATVMVVALMGLLINLGAVWLLAGDRESLNVRAALLHVIGDLLGSVAALISGLVIVLTDWTPIDPILSLLIVMLILISAARLMREAVLALMEGVPMHLDLEEVGYAMAATAGVRSVHDLHIWSLSSRRAALSAHVVVAELGEWPEVLAALRTLLARDFGIEHTTLQPETDGAVVPLRLVQRRHRRVPRSDGDARRPD